MNHVAARPWAAGCRNWLSWRTAGKPQETQQANSALAATRAPAPEMPGAVRA